VPFLLHSPHCREGNTDEFNEQQALKGSLGVFPAVDAVPLIMAHAGRLAEYEGP
jgi:2,3-bisphosphoglycerate-independent phosphoglycerate mutase